MSIMISIQAEVVSKLVASLHEWLHLMLVLTSGPVQMQPESHERLTDCAISLDVSISREGGSLRNQRQATTRNETAWSLVPNVMLTSTLQHSRQVVSLQCAAT